LSISITNKTRRPTPRAAFAKIAEQALGPEYELSLVFCGNALSHKLNATYRDKDYPTNVLSFPISKKAGEIFINLAKLGEFSVVELFIHGLFHLNGMQHGRKMEAAEKALLHESKRRRWH
jgi:probable rRNA maturation factor